MSGWLCALLIWVGILGCAWLVYAMVTAPMDPNDDDWPDGFKLT